MYSIAPNNTGDVLATMAPNAVREMWQKGCDVHEQTEDIFRRFEGGPDSVIETKTDFATGSGMTLNFTPRSGFHNAGRSGDQAFTDSAHFAPIKIGHDSLRVDYLRNAFQYNMRMEELMGMRNEITNGLNEEMGKWFGREQTYRMAMCILHKTNSENFVLAGGRQSIDALRSADTLTVDEILGMNARLRPMGGLPAIMGQDKNGNDVWGTVVIGNTCAVTGGLKLDPDYKQILRESVLPENNKLLFRGGIADIDANHVHEWNDVDHDGDGAVGTPFNPKAYLGVPITGATTTFQITGGGSLNSDGSLTTPAYFRFFPCYAFEFIAGDTLATTGSGNNAWDLHTGLGSVANTFYVTIVNPRDGTANQGKFCIYECTTNSGNQLTVTARLGATDSGIRFQTVGGVTWDANLHTVTHPTGSLIYLSTADGLPYGFVPMLCRRGLRRGWGAERLRRGQEGEEDNFITKVYVRSVFGQAPRKDRAGRVPGVLVLKTALNYKGWNIPVVTS